jgi:hypothetical protein
MIINFPLYIVLILLLISFVFVKFYILCIVGPHQPFGCQIPSTTYLSNKVYLLTYLLTIPPESRILLPGVNLGKIPGRIMPRFWLLEILLPGKNLGENPSRILLRFWPARVSLPGRNHTGIPLEMKILEAKISLRSLWDPAKTPVLILQGWEKEIYLMKINKINHI